ncbi:MAG: hypothetical protein O7J95_05600, partial [Planctomycetota bacterium]|nr:hypothetical protein [Planctomycetota bacterium]
QVPADANQDGSFDISDAITLLQFLFLGGGRSFPCGDVIAEGGNRILLDTNGDGGVREVDAVSALSYLFQGGPAPALGTTCTPIAGCPDVCGI